MTDRTNVLPSPSIQFQVRQAMRCSPSHEVDAQTPPDIAKLADELDQLLKRTKPKD